VAACDWTGTSDPYCVVKSSFNKQTFKTKVHWKTLNPKWVEEFKFFTGKPDGEIYIKMWDRDRFSSDDFMGNLTLKVTDFSDGLYHDKWYPLENEPMKQKKTKIIGELHLKCWFSGPNSTPERVLAEKNKPAEKKSDKPESTSDVAQEPKKQPVKEEEPKATKIEDRYEMGKVLGRGAFSVVQVGIRKTTQKKFAVKCISKKTISEKELRLLEREITVMKRLEHPHIIQLMEVLDTPDTLYLVLEYATGGELFDAIVSKGSYGEDDAVHIIYQVVDAMNYVHKLGIAHRDLKPENLLLSNAPGEKEYIKIADFGLSKDTSAEGMLKTQLGTPDYVAPEVLSGEEYDSTVDMWSIGVISYILLCGFPPFFGDSQKELFESIMGAKFDFPDPEWTHVSSDAKKFIKKILVVDPKERYTAEQALEDPWIKKYMKDDLQKAKLKSTMTFNVEKFTAYTKKYKESVGKN